MYLYGHRDETGYPLAAWIWGHRLRHGQDWMEYLLEFLNVLAGFDYELGQGITEGATDVSSQVEYTRFTRLGLRRFVFYDAREKSRNQLDDQALELLNDYLENNVVDETSFIPQQEILQLVKALLQAFTTIEKQRSWYAKSLFPAHHNLLFWEAIRRKNKNNKKGLDEGVEFTARNFFARGGEVYYLILSAATQDNLDQRQRISDNLETILKNHNQGVGKLAQLVDETWGQIVSNGFDVPKDNSETGTLGWIPDPDCGIYKIIADDIDRFLQTELDPLETLDLLAHLIGFHLTLYIYHRSYPDPYSEIHMSGQCLETCRLSLLIDAGADVGSNIIRRVSSSLFQEQEAKILRKGEEYVQSFVETWQGDIEQLQSEARVHFSLTRLHQSTRQPFDDQVYRLDAELQNNRINLTEYLTAYSEALCELLMGDFRKNFLGVHRKLAKSVGFVAPQIGPNARFVLEDNLLKALTLANLPAGRELTFNRFLAQLYERYGIVVGAIEARESGLLDRQRINVEYYERNKSALLEKMKYAGLATEYSDATAMIGISAQSKEVS